MKNTLLVLLVSLIAVSSAFAEPVSEARGSEINEMQVFVDSLGREVQVPSRIARIAPSGSNAQVIVFQVSPEKLCGLSTKLSESEKTVYPAYTHDLPVFGTLYGKKANLNKETLIIADPDIIIDVGEIKGSVDDMRRDLDSISAEIGVPVVFIEADMDSYPDVFRSLGRLLGCEKRAESLAKYYENAVAEIEGCITSSRPTVYITSSNDGLGAVIGGKSHAQCAEKAGAEVVVTSKLAQSNGSISLETLYSLDPQFIFAYTEEGYRTITSGSDWATLSAVQDGKVYLVPSMPHGFIDQPICSNRIIGLYYLADILYPQSSIDIVGKTREFYQTFYGAEISESRAREILHLD